MNDDKLKKIAIVTSVFIVIASFVGGFVANVSFGVSKELATFVMTLGIWGPLLGGAAIVRKIETGRWQKLP
jgi:hypothetical protein